MKFTLSKLGRAQYQVFDANGAKIFTYPVSKHEAELFIIECKVDARFLANEQMKKVAMKFITDNHMTESSFGDLRQFMANSIYKMYHGDIRDLMRRQSNYREHLEKITAKNKVAREQYRV